MNVSDKNLNFFTIDLHSLNNLPANTLVHKDRTGHFIPTAAKFAWIPGVQTVTSKIKGQTSQELADDIDDFSKQVIASMSNKMNTLKNSTDTQSKQQIYRQLYVICREIEDVMKPKEDGGGILGLFNTYAFDKKFCERLKRSTQSLSLFAKEIMDKAEKEVDKEFIQNVNICPEDTFSDEEWMEAIEHSHDLRKEYTSLKKYYLNYKTALLFNEAMNFINLKKASIGEVLGKDWDSSWNWWDEVYVHPDTGAKLFLGALPVANEAFGNASRNDLKTLKQLGVGAVLSLVEVFENKSDGIVTSPIKPDDWEDEGILQLQVPTPDFETMSVSQLQRVAAFIDWNLRNGRSCYIHCKAGRGRSKLGVDCYLVKYQGLSAEDAYNYVKMKRPQAGYHGDKMNTLIEFEKQFGHKKQ